MIVSCFTVRKQAQVRGRTGTCLGSQRPCHSQARIIALPAYLGLHFSVSLAWDTQRRVGRAKCDLVSEVSSWDRRSGPKCLELDLAQPGASWAWKALSEACPPAVGQALRGWERTDEASAPGNLWSNKGDKAYNYERLCDSL